MNTLRRFCARMPGSLPLGLGFLAVGLSGQTPFLTLGLVFLVLAATSWWSGRSR